MGGNKQQQQKQKKSSSFSVFNLFKTRKPRGWEESWEESLSKRKVFRSDYDKSHGLVADPKVDIKAGAFIDKVHKSRITESDCQTMGELQPVTVTVYPAGKP